MTEKQAIGGGQTKRHNRHSPRADQPGAGSHRQAFSHRPHRQQPMAAHKGGSGDYTSRIFPKCGGVRGEVRQAETEGHFGDD